MGLILLILLLVLLFAGLPAWPYSRNWGYAPTGGLGLLLLMMALCGFGHFLTKGLLPFWRA